MPSKNVWKQCPGCWSAALWPADVDHECECGERLVTIDLRDGDYRLKVYGVPSQPVSGGVVAADLQNAIAELAGPYGRMALALGAKHEAVRKGSAAFAKLRDAAAALASSPNPETAAGMLREFHDTFGIEDEERRAVSLRLLSEEFAEVEVELQEWSAGPFPTDYANVKRGLIARELADLTYVAYGTAQAFGIDLDAALREVHRANMSKLGTDGKPIKREDGKVLKGPNFTPPNMAAAIQSTQKEN